MSKDDTTTNAATNDTPAAGPKVIETKQKFDWNPVISGAITTAKYALVGLLGAGVGGWAMQRRGKKALTQAHRQHTAEMNEMLNTGMIDQPSAGQQPAATQQQRVTH